jgi:hypothetical protein
VRVSTLKKTDEDTREGKEEEGKKVEKGKRTRSRMDIAGVRAGYLAVTL